MPEKKRPPSEEKGEAAKREIVEQPGKDDVHEQREQDQDAEGEISPPASGKP